MKTNNRHILIFMIAIRYIALLAFLSVALPVCAQNTTIRNLKVTNTLRLTPSAGVGKILTCNSATGLAAWVTPDSLGIGYSPFDTLANNIIQKDTSLFLGIGITQPVSSLNVSGNVFICPQRLWQNFLDSTGLLYPIPDFTVTNLDTATNARYNFSLSLNNAGLSIVPGLQNVEEFGSLYYVTDAITSIFSLNRSDGTIFQNGIYMNDTADINTGNVELSVFDLALESDIASIQLFREVDSNAFIRTILYDIVSATFPAVKQYADSTSSFISELEAGDFYVFKNDTTSITLSSTDLILTGQLTVAGVPAYEDDTAAGIGGLTVNQVYQTTGTGAAPLNVPGILMIKQP